MHSLMLIFGATLLAFVLVIGLMAVGVILGRRAIKGSCGGLGGSQAESGESCSLCSNPTATCKELARRSQGATPAEPLDQAQPVPHDECDRQCEANGCSQEEIEACNRS